MYEHYEEVSGVPAMWERTFHELLGCFKTPESSIKAFRVLDTDGNGLVDARELLGALAVVSRGHLTERLALVFDVYDFSREKAISFDECFLMIRRTLVGLRKMVSIHTPPEKVIHNMTKQVWKQAQKHRDARISHSDWYAWWSSDASCRGGLKMFVWKPEEQRGLPAPDSFINVDYTKGGGFENEQPAPEQRQMRGSFLNTLSPSPVGGSRPASANRMTPPKVAPHDARPRRASFCAIADTEGNVSRAVHEDDFPGFKNEIDRSTRELDRPRASV
jgi:Ca2+-binding EF-hand superfamily protein